jgi:hypothetical protein
MELLIPSFVCYKQEVSTGLFLLMPLGRKATCWNPRLKTIDHKQGNYGTIFINAIR